MKKYSPFLLFLICLSGFMASQARSATLPGVIENIAAAVRSGNSKSLAVYFSQALEITLPGKEGTFSKVQAEMVMKDFFSKNPANSFSLDQKGTSAGGSQFMIGTYKSGNRVYKTYFLLKPADGQLQIQQIQFDPE